MARLFDDGSTEYLQRASAIVTNEPFTIAAWIRTNDDTVSQAIVSVNESGDDGRQYVMHYDGANSFGVDNGITALKRHDDSQFSGGQSTVGLAVNTWGHACAVFTDNTNRSAYLNGTNKGTGGDATADPTVDKIDIGRLGDSTPGAYFSGDIAEVGIWNVALTDAEVASLADGFSPLFVRPQSLVAYWDLIRGLNDKVGGYNLTASGTTISNHPRIINPYSPQISYPVGYPNISKSLSVTLEMEVAMTRKMTYPLASTIEMEAIMTRDMNFPLSTTLEMEAILTRHLKLPLSTTIEFESVMSRKHTMPLSVLLELGTSAVRKLTFPLSAILEPEAAVTLSQLGLKKSISVTLEMEALMTRGMTFPLSAVVNMDASVVMAITGLDNPVLYFNAKDKLFYLTSESKNYRYIGKNKNFRITYNEGD